MNSTRPFISICIPAYERIDYLRRLLDSIQIQTFKGFEVIVTDDSSSDKVANLCTQYEKSFFLQYHKNSLPLGTPANWNAGVLLAQGEWIKLMHDDDWFADKYSLQHLANAVHKHPNSELIFSAYYSIDEIHKRKNLIRLNLLWKFLLQSNPASLIYYNAVGHPSVVLHRNDPKFMYDSNVKWVVDLDFYIRYFSICKWLYYNEPLVNVSINESQVTNYTFGIPQIHLCENLYLLNKIGANHLKNVFVFDAWWRLLRNFSIDSTSQIKDYCLEQDVAFAISWMIKFKRRFRSSWLRFGLFSKLSMLFCYTSLRMRRII